MPEKNKVIKCIASFLLFFVFVYAFSPLSFLVSVPVAQAQCSGGSCGSSAAAGGLGEFLGGGSGLENMMMIMMIISMMMQLFQGGSSPQQGPAEENASRPATVGPSQTGDRNNTNPTSSPSPLGLADQSIFLTITDDELTLMPTTLTVVRGSGFNFFNTTESDQAVRIYNAATPATALNQTVPAGSAQVFNLQNAGTYKVCLVNDDVEDCQSTVTVP